MKFCICFIGILTLGVFGKCMESNERELNLNDKATSEEAEAQQTSINIMPPGTNSKSIGRGSRINLEFIAGNSGSAGGVTYIRWGKTSCPPVDGTELVYKGMAAGTHYGQKGGGTDLLCLPEKSKYLKTRNGHTGAYIYQTEYQTNVGPTFHNLQDYNVPCATCYASRGSKLMIPGTTECFQGWTREYYGYLMTERHSHHRMTYSCVDASPEGIPGTRRNEDGALLYFAEIATGSLGSAYPNGYELTCVVCTK